MITGQAPKVSKEPKFVGPEEIPFLPKYLTEQNPEQAGHYHLLLQEWWESVHENLNRIRDMIVKFQVGELRETTDSTITNTRAVLNDLIVQTQEDLEQARTDLVADINAVSGSLSTVATTGSYTDLSNQPTTLSLLSGITATTGAAGTSASYNASTGVFTIPKGDKGDPGPVGATFSYNAATETLTITT
jgi:hypothetical protein